MASTTTGEMFTQAEYEAMSVQERSRLGLVSINEKEQAKLEPMSLEERKDWLGRNKSKKPTRRQRNKQERQNRAKARK